MGYSGIFLDRVTAVMRSIDAHPGLDGRLNAAVEQAMTLVPACDAAGGVLLGRRRRIADSAATSASAAAADQLQGDLGEGPLLDVAHDVALADSNDVAGDRRWPEWAPVVARQHGFRAVMSTRLDFSDRTSGALTFYSATGTFGDDDRRAAQLLAAHVSTSLDAAKVRETLERAVETRTTIGQAQGLLMERLEIDAEQAIALLKRVSQQTNVKLSQIAEEVVSTRVMPGEHASDPAAQN